MKSIQLKTFCTNLVLIIKYLSIKLLKRFMEPRHGNFIKKIVRRRSLVPT